MIPVTLLHTAPCGRRRRLDVDLPVRPRAGWSLFGFLDPPGAELHTLRLLVEQVLGLSRDGRVIATVSLPGRPEGVPATLWTAAGWRADGCGG